MSKAGNLGKVSQKWDTSVSPARSHNLSLEKAYTPPRPVQGGQIGHFGSQFWPNWESGPSLGMGNFCLVISRKLGINWESEQRLGILAISWPFCPKYWPFLANLASQTPKKLALAGPSVGAYAL